MHTSSNANDFLRPSHSSSSQINNFQTISSTVLPPQQQQPPPIPPLNDAQKKTLRHLDTLVEVVSKKVAEQMEQNKLLNMSFTDMSGGGGGGMMGNINKRKRETLQQQQQQQQQQGVDSVSRTFSDLSVLAMLCVCAILE
jgi:hypothetical protein